MSPPAGRCRLVFALIAAAGLTGCGGPKLVPVEGQVLWDDGTPAKELAGCIVESTVPGSAVTSRGTIDADGRFKLGTDKPDDGAEPGTHQVAITPYPRLEFEPAPKVKLPARYTRPDTSGLTYAAERGKVNAVTLTVGRK
jgi:hypothetical protein